MRHCNSCGQTKEDFEFYKSGSKCVACYRAYCKDREEKIKNGTWQPKNKNYSPNAETKICKECLQTLSVNDFYIDKTKGYYSSKCKTCSSYDRMQKRVEKGALPRKDYERHGMYSIEFREEMLQLHEVMEKIRMGKIKHDPIEHEEFCKKHKVLHYREWVFNPKRLIEIENEIADEDEDIKIKRKRAKLQREGININNMNDDEILNYLNI